MTDIFFSVIIFTAQQAQRIGILHLHPVIVAWWNRDDGEHQIRPRPVDGPVRGARSRMDVALRMNGENLASSSIVVTQDRT